MKKRVYMIDGKPVLSFLFAAETKIALAGKSHRMLLQVEAFSKDHAYQRCKERYPGLKWEWISDLDPEHDVGMMGEKLPLNPLIVPGSLRVQ